MVLATDFKSISGVLTSFYYAYQAVFAGISAVKASHVWLGTSTHLPHPPQSINYEKPSVQEADARSEASSTLLLAPLAIASTARQKRSISSSLL
jgi:hypothetical protein